MTTIAELIDELCAEYSVAEGFNEHDAAIARGAFSVLRIELGIPAHVDVRHIAFVDDDHRVTPKRKPKVTS